jgi:hypothetical protein
MEVILFTIVAAAYDKLKEQAIAIFIILFALIQFFFQFDANTVPTVAGHPFGFTYSRFLFC